ncbi:unnamed protein product [Mytilus coruscus]|uniref:Uncharacterized protein n=1 Tax=Mytilus coruscus TaxID=42192 RepID=A0A6J8CXM6_MYTCO|nr:unnamed protein product [Mytilus coruscus]
MEKPPVLPNGVVKSPKYEVNSIPEAEEEEQQNLSSHRRFHFSVYYDWDDDKLRYSGSEEDLYTNPSYREITILDDTFVDKYLTGKPSIYHDSENSNSLPAGDDLAYSIHDVQPPKIKQTKKNIMDKLASYWQTIKELFNAKYVKFNWESPSVVIENQLFNSLKLNTGQEIGDFYCQLVEKAELLSKPEHEVMSKFVDGLPDKLAFNVRASKPKDASDALTLAKTGEAYKYRECENTVSAARNISTSQSEISSVKHQMNQLTDLMNDMHENTKTNR